jgi:hypothetical protein
VRCRVTRSGTTRVSNTGKVPGSDSGKELGTTSDKGPGNRPGKNSGNKAGQDKMSKTERFLCFRSLSQGVQTKKRIKEFGLSLKTELRKKFG